MPLFQAALASLPIVTSASKFAEYDHAFGQFLPQLYELPHQIYASLSDPEALKTLYLTTNPAVFGLAVALALCPIFFVVSEVNKNYSQVDRCWSLLPTLFHIHYAVWTRLNRLPTSRVDTVLAFSVLWSMRLTYNYWRRGGYQVGSEDYRWMLIKDKIGNFAFSLLNIVFTSSAQVVLLWAVTLPTYLILIASRIEPSVTSYDLILSRLLMGLIVVEYFADQQQWDFHKAKHEYQKTAKVPAGWTRAQLERGFNTTGLWKYSRHPNFAAEQAIWVILYQWGCFASYTRYNWTAVGMIGYLLVFVGSTPLTEGISSGKYPEYKLYQKQVGKFVPTIFSRGWNEAEALKEGPKYVAEAKQAAEQKTK